MLRHLLTSEDPRSGHSHSVTSETDTRRLGIALGLIIASMAAEVVAGILAHSLALLSDATHMLTDAGAFGLSLVVIRLARPHLHLRHADARESEDL